MRPSTTKLHARILRGKGVQKKPNMFTLGSATSMCIYIYTYIYIYIHIYIYTYIYIRGLNELGCLVELITGL